MSTNGTTLRQLLERKQSLLQALDEIKAPILPRIEQIEKELSEVAGAITAKATDQAKNAFLAQQKDTGTINFYDGDVEVKAVVDKKVEWDQKQLLQIREKIRSAGDDPSQYLQEKLSVSERAFNAWPDQIKSVFMPARTVKPGMPKFEFKILETKDIPF